MKKNNYLVWTKIVHIICWIIFLCYCIQTGTFLFNYIFSLFNLRVVFNLNLGLNLSELFKQNKIIYESALILAISTSWLKAYIFYIVLQLLKSLRIERPFTQTVLKLIRKITLYTFIAGILCFIFKELINKLTQIGYNLDQIDMYWSDGSTFLVMSAILVVITLIFQRGIELQTENDLTL